MPRIRLTVAYVGTRYQGWQIQGRGETIQGAIEDKLARICGELVRVHGSGRTDSGVHALAQVAHFDVPESKRHIPWRQALNAMLPDDISILEAREAQDDFHARFSVRSKRYAYTLWTEPRFTMPQRAPFVWPVRGLDFEAMDQAAEVLAGTHDFAAFQNAGTEIKGTVRTLEPIVRAPGTHSAEWVFRFQADGFLKQMVRNLMGLLVEVGRGGLAPADVRPILEGCDRRKAPATAPARGLTLEEVMY
ncbi:tRNA pseudouridine(38-40) synthase TruA [Desulfomicrobium baculatum]|uniref:tRNA pseudouridine synthase A n=1 Tax=Desulfomicrobium baculatum (strain DSM 4028 / VKM B-1378 / X) TaxID=525897 RepID=C7LQD1_DESBD|nr:tRNA pseudouridine(38-40) synthase TruA [Desulfomicrobium baculatum]ACU90333.1 tRNA pseudouridine synthase A [Desulfomicrobium baculatum DSM 4028]